MLLQWVEAECPTHVLYSGLEVRLLLTDKRAIDILLSGDLKDIH